MESAEGLTREASFSILPPTTAKGGRVIRCDRDKAMDFCDLNCRFASWPKDGAVDGSGSCRTFQALFCSKENRLVPKNAPCLN